MLFHREIYNKTFDFGLNVRTQLRKILRQTQKAGTGKWIGKSNGFYNSEQKKTLSGFCCNCKQFSMKLKPNNRFAMFVTKDQINFRNSPSSSTEEINH